MTEPKLHTTREERDAHIFARNSHPTWLESGYSCLLAKDCNALEDELARVRNELACEKILREGAEGRALMILESKNTINDKLREELGLLREAVFDVLYRTDVAEVDGQDCVRTQRLRNAYQRAGEFERFGGRDDSQG